MSQNRSDELAAIVRLSVYAVAFRDDMDTIRNIKGLYRSEVKVSANTLQRAMMRTFKEQIDELHKDPNHSEVVVNAWNSLEKMFNMLGSLTLYELIKLAEKIEEHDNKEDFLARVGCYQEAAEHLG